MTGTERLVSRMLIMSSNACCNHFKNLNFLGKKVINFTYRKYTFLVKTIKYIIFWNWQVIGILLFLKFLIVINFLTQISFVQFQKNDQFRIFLFHLLVELYKIYWFLSFQSCLIFCPIQTAFSMIFRFNALRFIWRGCKSC